MELEQRHTNQLILYKDFEYGTLFYDFSWIMENYKNDYYNKEDVEALLYDCLHELMELAVSHGFEGNLWHNFLTFLMVNNANAYSTACEIRGSVEGSINQVALHDFRIMKSLFDFDLSVLETYFSVECMDAVKDYVSINGNSRIFNKRIRDRICGLTKQLERAETGEQFKEFVTDFYRDFGVGKLGLHKAFRI